MTILVTGALGNVGSAVVEALLADDVRVRVADRDPARLEDRWGGRAEVVRLDFEDPATFARALAGVGPTFLIRPPAISRVGPTLNAFVDAAVVAGVPHVVFSSVAGADENRIVPHHRVERHLMAADVGWTMLRPGFFAQNIATAYRIDIVEDDRIVLPAGNGLVAFIDARDIGAVAAQVLVDPLPHRRAGHHLTGPRALGFAEVADLLTERLDRRIRYEPASILGYHRHLRRQGLVQGQAVVQTLLHAGLRRGDAEPVTDTVERLLGRPATPIETYLDDHLSRWRR